MTKIVSAGTSTYTLNADATISTRTDDTVRNYSVVPGTISVAVASGNNQLSTTSGTLLRTYAYDGAGNTTSTGAATFTYDGANRLTVISQGSTSTSFIVNSLGQRVRKTSGGVTTLFAYDEEGHLLGEYGGSGNLIEETVWLGDTPVATLQPNGSGGVNIYYLHTDHLNTPRRISRPSDNAIVWAWSSDPFGNGFVDQNPDGDGQYFVYNLRFPGQYYDAETGLNYNYRRDYDSAVGRYVESDPIGLDGGSYSTYAYVGGNPIIRFDPLGLMGSGGGGSGTHSGVVGTELWPPSLPQGFVDAAAGLGDSFLLEQGARLRRLLGVDGGVNTCSGSYKVGQVAGGVALAISGYGLVSDVAAVKSTGQALFMTGQLIFSTQSLADLTISEQLLSAVEASSEQTIEETIATINRIASTRPTRIVW